MPGLFLTWEQRALKDDKLIARESRSNNSPLFSGIIRRKDGNLGSLPLEGPAGLQERQWIFSHLQKTSFEVGVSRSNFNNNIGPISAKKNKKNKKRFPERERVRTENLHRNAEDKHVSQHMQLLDFQFHWTEMITGKGLIKELRLTTWSSKKKMCMTWLIRIVSPRSIVQWQTAALNPVVINVTIKVEFEYFQVRIKELHSA